MKIELQRVNNAFHFEAKNENNKLINIDASPTIGGNDNGFRPMELLLAGLGGCSGIDVLHILKKQKIELETFSIKIEASRKDEQPAIFEEIKVLFEVKGNIDETKLKRAIDLSMEKYCSVTKILEKSATIKYSYKLNS